MRNFFSRSVRGKFVFAVLATTFAALLVGSTALVLYELRLYERTWSNDLMSQAKILANSAAAALAFDDPEAAKQDLAALRVRPHILSAAIYTADGTVFASY